MKIFAVYSDVKLTRKPAWLDAFRARFDELYEYHITLKQPCFIQDEQIPGLKGKLKDFFAKSGVHDHYIDIAFDRLTVRPDAPMGGCIMIDAQKAPMLMKLQKKLREELSAFQNYFTPESAQWERDFTPHITIARHLPPERLEEAKLSLQEDIACTGSITQVYLQIVEDKTSEQARKHENRTVFKL